MLPLLSKVKKRLVLAIPLTGPFASLRAEPLNLQYNQTLFSYVSQNGDSRETQWATSPVSGEVIISRSGWHLHVFPSGAYAPVLLGYDAFSGWEIGASFGGSGRQIITEPHFKESQENLGIFGVYAWTCAAGAIEFGLFANRLDSEIKDDADPIGASNYHEKYSEEATSLSFVHTVAEGFSLTPTLYASQFKREDLTNVQTVKGQVWSISPLAIRLDF